MSEEFLFDKSLEQIKFMFRLAGLNIENTERSHKQTFIFILNFLWHETDVCSGFSWIIAGMLNGKSFTELTYVVPCVIFGILADIKVVFLFCKENKAHRLMESLRDCEIRAKKFEIVERDALIKPDITFLSVIIKVFNTVNCMMFIIFTVFPHIFIVLKYLVTGQLELVLPFLDFYIYFDALDPKYWPFAYAHQFWSACVALFNVCAIDYFFFTCCTHIRLQFKLLQNQFQNMAINKNHEQDPGHDVLTVFRDLIQWHQQIISSGYILEDIYTKSTLCNFMAGSLMIWLTGFNVTSMDVGDAVYTSKWYRQHLSMCGNLLLVQTRARKPCKLTAAGFADVNLKAYMRILSTAWSYFALLQTLYAAHSKK